MMEEEMGLLDRMRGVWLGFRVRTRYAIGKRRRPRKPKLSTIFGDKAVPVCPRCGDLVYYPKQCVTCGQRFIGNVTTIGEMIDHDTDS